MEGEIFTMILVLGCLISFLAGAGIALAAQEFLLRRDERRERSSMDAPIEDATQENGKFREQWLNFLSYDGSDQNGGF